MRYILDRRYRFRGWYGAPYGIYDTRERTASFFGEDLYRLLMRCDAVQEIGDADDRQRRFLGRMLAEGIIREAGFWDFLAEEQKYRAYPARYRREAHWSVTGECNLKCRHCFMSAPHAKHGSPTREQIVRIADQLAECGVFPVSITGGEPLIRRDLPEIIDLLKDDWDFIVHTPAILELVPPGTDKGTGLTRALDALGLTRGDSVAFGDSMNDLAMFNAAGLKIAMGNSSPALMDLADHVTTALHDDGIWNAWQWLQDLFE